MRSEKSGSSPMHSGASSCSTMAATTGGEPSAAPMPARPLSVSTRMSVASLLTFVPRSVRCWRSRGTGSDIGIARTRVIFTAFRLHYRTHEPAVDAQRGACDVARFRRCEKRDEVRELFRLADAPERGLRRALLQRRLDRPALFLRTRLHVREHALGQYGAGTHVVHEYP